MRRSSRQYRRTAQSRNRGMMAILAVVTALLLVLGSHARTLQRQAGELAARQVSLTEQVAAESERAVELEEKSVYVQTRDYVEQMARERLGLVVPDETIIRPQ